MNNSWKDTFKSKMLRKRISSSGYHLRRLNETNNKIQYWILSLQEANTKAGRKYCSEMINMYLKRYIFYLTK